MPTYAHLSLSQTHAAITTAPALPPTVCEQPDVAWLLLHSMQRRLQESHLQGELSQTSRDKEEAQKQCADLQRRHAQAQHEIRRKVHHALTLYWSLQGLIYVEFSGSLPDTSDRHCMSCVRYCRGPDSGRRL